MSKVTIEDIYDDIKHGSVSDYAASKDFEVVPRKMVEMIIDYAYNLAKCDYENSKYAAHIGDVQGAMERKHQADAISSIVQYGNLLLAEFEDDGEA